MQPLTPRAAAGLSARRAGAAFESVIAAHHEAAIRLGLLATVEKIEPPARLVRTAGGMRLLYVAPGVTDWIGVLRGGRALSVEAKSTKRGRLARADVKPRQQAWLDACARTGGLSVLVVEFRREDEVLIRPPERFAVPWLKVPWQVGRSAESIGPEDLKGWELGTRSYLGGLA